MRVGQTGPD